jgi:hypothetical protein
MEATHPEQPGEKAMRFYTERTGGQGSWAGFAACRPCTQPAFQDERGQFIKEDGERVDGVWLVTDEERPKRR